MPTARSRARIGVSMNCVQAPSFSPLRRLPRRRCGGGAAAVITRRRLSLTHRRKLQPFAVRSSSSPAPGHPDLLRPVSSALAGDGANGARRTTAPAVRSYECDLCRLGVVGPVDLEQALTAAAIDGGALADEHLDSGVEDMVVETVFPGSRDSRSTISTRLFLPAKKVKDKAKKLKSSLDADIMAHGKPDAILAMTFRQVILHSIWSFELAVFAAGSWRNMDELANPRQILPTYSMSSSDGKVLSMLAEVICSCVMKSSLESASNVGGKASSKAFPWFKKSETFFSSDSSVSLCKIHEYEMIRDAKTLLANSKAKEISLQPSKRKLKDLWFMSPFQLKFEPIGSSELQAWACENVPAYRIQIDGDKYECLKFQGWHKTVENKWEALLTHFQMVDLANILDIYYEDQCTNPDEHLPHMQVSLPKLSKSKKSSFWQMLLVTLASGSVLVAINVIAKLCQPGFFKHKQTLSIPSNVEIVEVECLHEESLGDTEVESLCRMVIEKIKETLSWHGDVTFKPDVGAWIGELPACLKDANLSSTKVASCVNDVRKPIPTSGDTSDQTNKSDAQVLIYDESSSGIQASTSQDVANYQVVLSREGNVVGFMPMSRAAVNYWATNPLAKLLYKWKKLSPSIFEPGLKIQRPDKVISLELLMSTNGASQFALVRCGKPI